MCACARRQGIQSVYTDMCIHGGLRVCICVLFGRLEEIGDGW